ncbi:LysE family transporter [Desulfosporosinus nitroreducens]|uniref:LysE family transporter n=1 Tax=Desulfosporosinus nitroreducens TaxID=2018668 RepID=UPI00207CC4D2|nr:LysE family transporter [Desulfosporosinus nitroreducens]MCO1603906.1 LysE family transporter [Desulfosporosinus nitroreducens]
MARKKPEYAAGAALAFGLLHILSVTFNSVLFEALPKIKLVMGGVGAVYMLYLAWKLSKMDVSAAETTAETDQVGISFKEGFLMQFINPRVICIDGYFKFHNALLFIPFSPGFVRFNYYNNRISGFCFMGHFWGDTQIFFAHLSIE